MKKKEMNLIKQVFTAFEKATEETDFPKSP
jgi:hypothetical protein